MNCLQVGPVAETDYVIAYVPNDYEPEQQAANAALIIAAPDLLNACYAALGSLGESWPLSVDQIRAALLNAIAKAEGRNA